MTPDHVIAWLSNLPADSIERKRKREPPLPSPPRSVMNPRSDLQADSDVDPNTRQQRKRLRTDENPPLDPNQTPRPLRTNTNHQHPLASTPSLSSVSASQSGTDISAASREEDSARGAHHSRASGRTSPRKRLRGLALQDDGIITRDFGGAAADMPAELRELLVQIIDISNGIDVISRDRRQEIENVTPNTSFRHPYPHNYASEDQQQQNREALGPTPSVHDVVAVLQSAAYCAAHPAEEAMWNSAVHLPLLQMAVHGARTFRPQPSPPSEGNAVCVSVGITQCTTARIIREYLPTKETSGKQVDFCLHLDLDASSTTTMAKIDRIRASLPLQSINHTDLEGLVNRPIAISCESKKPDSDGGAIQAKLQIGLWHAAQWKLLKSLVAAKQQRQRPEQHREQEGNDDGDGSDDQGQPPPLLPKFLPAILIAGHDWSLAATTQMQGKTVLWTAHPFGHTRDAVGVYRIVCGLQRLQTWATDDYWLWYHDNVLEC